MSWTAIFKTSLLGLGGLVGFLFGEASVLFYTLLVFIGVDWLSGMIASHINGELSSKVGFKGVLKKVMILCVVALAHMLDETYGTKGTIRDAVIFFYIGNELLSFVENAGRIGLPLPSQITNAVAVLKQKSEEK